MRRLVLLVPMLIALVAGATACSDATNGSPVASGTSTEDEPATTTTTTRSNTTGNPSGDSPIKGKDPCTLLPADGQAKFGVSNGENRTVGVARTCRWRLRGPSETFLFDVGILEKAGIKDLPGNVQVKQLADIGKHKAAQYTGPDEGNCTIILGVTEASRVDTGVTAGTDTNKACDLAMQLAQFVEPELPQG